MHPFRRYLGQRPHYKGPLRGTRMRQDQAVFATHNDFAISDKVKIKHARCIETSIAHTPSFALQVM